MKLFCEDANRFSAADIGYSYSGLRRFSASRFFSRRSFRCGRPLGEKGTNVVEGASVVAGYGERGSRKELWRKA